MPVEDKNPLNLEVGKEYLLQYVHCNSEPIRVKITRFTKDDYPWMEGVHCGANGIVSPNCWELIAKIALEKDYEILSFKEENKTDIWKPDSRLKDVFCILYDRHPLKYTQDILNDDSFYIHSVERLSDGEIFTVGDYVNCKTWFGKIFKFEIIDGKLKVFQTQNLQSNKYKPYDLDIVKREKQKLFKTEDGVDIFESDSYWVVNNHNHSIFQAKNGVTGTTHHFAVYSTEEEAKKAVLEWDIMNTPGLSINDLLKTRGFISDWFINDLKEVIKSKLE